ERHEAVAVGDLLPDQVIRRRQPLGPNLGVAGGTDARQADLGDTTGDEHAGPGGHSAPEDRGQGKQAIGAAMLYSTSPLSLSSPPAAVAPRLRRDPGPAPRGMFSPRCAPHGRNRREDA